MKPIRANVSGADVFTPAVMERLIRANGDISALRTNDGYLREDDWKTIDTVVKDITQKRLTVVQDMRNAGMVNPINNLGVLLSQWETVTDMPDATQSMDGRQRGDKGALTYSLNTIPIPITHGDFEIPLRRALARERGSLGGMPLDMSTIQKVTRKVNEKLEYAALNGSGITVNGDTIPGLLDHTDRVTGSLTDGWEDSENRDPVQDIINMRDELVSLGYPEEGPYNVYVSSLYAPYLENDQNSYKTKTVKQRMKEITGINDVKVASKIPHSNQSGVSDDHVLLVYMSSEDMVIDQAADIQVVEWAGEGGFVRDYKVFAAMVLRIMSDSSSQVGIVDYSDTP